MHEKIADFPAQNKVAGLSLLPTLSKQSHVLKGWFSCVSVCVCGERGWGGGDGGG